VSGANDDYNVGRFGFVSLQAIRIGVAPVGEIHHLSRLDPPASAGSTMLSPWLSRKNVCSPNNLFSCGTTGWLSGMTSPSNWVRVRSTCADVNFIAHWGGVDWAHTQPAARCRTLRGLPPQVVKRYARSFCAGRRKVFIHERLHGLVDMRPRVRTMLKIWCSRNRLWRAIQRSWPSGRATARNALHDWISVPVLVEGKDGGFATSEEFLCHV
jgi:hypothetical protein